MNAFIRDGAFLSRRRRAEKKANKSNAKRKKNNEVMTVENVDDITAVVTVDDISAVMIVDDITTEENVDDITTVDDIIIVENDDDTKVVENDDDTAVVENDDDITVVEYDDDTTIVENDDDTTVVENDDDTTVVENDDDTTVVENDADHCRQSFAGESSEDLQPSSVVIECEEDSSYPEDYLQEKQFVLDDFEKIDKSCVNECLNDILKVKDADKKKQILMKTFKQCYDKSKQSNPDNPLVDCKKMMQQIERKAYVIAVKENLKISSPKTVKKLTKKSHKDATSNINCEVGEVLYLKIRKQFLNLFGRRYLESDDNILFKDQIKFSITYDQIVSEIELKISKVIDPNDDIYKNKIITELASYFSDDNFLSKFDLLWGKIVSELIGELIVKLFEEFNNIERNMAYLSACLICIFREFTLKCSYPPCQMKQHFILFIDCVKKYAKQYDISFWREWFLPKMFFDWCSILACIFFKSVDFIANLEDMSILTNAMMYFKKIKHCNYVFMNNDHKRSKPMSGIFEPTNSDDLPLGNKGVSSDNISETATKMSIDEIVKEVCPVTIRPKISVCSEFSFSNSFKNDFCFVEVDDKKSKELELINNDVNKAQQNVSNISSCSKEAENPNEVLKNTSEIDININKKNTKRKNVNLPSQNPYFTIGNNPQKFNIACDISDNGLSTRINNLLQNVTNTPSSTAINIQSPNAMNINFSNVTFSQPLNTTRTSPSREMNVQSSYLTDSPQTSNTINIQSPNVMNIQPPIVTRSPQPLKPKKTRRSHKMNIQSSYLIGTPHSSNGKNTRRVNTLNDQLPNVNIQSVNTMNIQPSNSQDSLKMNTQHLSLMHFQPTNTMNTLPSSTMNYQNFNRMNTQYSATTNSQLTNNMNALPSSALNSQNTNSMNTQYSAATMNSHSLNNTNIQYSATINSYPTTNTNTQSSSALNSQNTNRMNTQPSSALNSQNTNRMNTQYSAATMNSHSLNNTNTQYSASTNSHSTNNMNTQYSAMIKSQLTNNMNPQPLSAMNSQYSTLMNSTNVINNQPSSANNSQHFNRMNSQYSTMMNYQPTNTMNIQSSSAMKFQNFNTTNTQYSSDIQPKSIMNNDLQCLANLNSRLFNRPITQFNQSATDGHKSISKSGYNMNTSHQYSQPNTHSINQDTIILPPQHQDNNSSSIVHSISGYSYPSTCPVPPTNTQLLPNNNVPHNGSSSAKESGIILGQNYGNSQCSNNYNTNRIFATHQPVRATMAKNFQPPDYNSQVSPDLPDIQVANSPNQPSSNNNMMKKCCSSGCMNRSSLTCYGCSDINYCSIQCLKSDWKYHENECNKSKE